ncbi:MAG: hypothetical protein PHI45_00660 [Candidatus Pacebacteria bacterium]|nr:hypothetical protein [Candidatus Paceibacterota bacterium]MDD5013006.1 hypothetical protein [Candidatus Paceibacterota bacterium]MDD5752590.1 hypothetical protein [Candidatus Paceibacterota bacterium]
MDLSIKYFKWQFIDKPKEIIKSIKNVLSFGLYFFSLKQIIVSFFTPWKGIVWENSRGFDLQLYFENFIGNIISIVIGMILRTFLIIICLIFEVVVLTLGILLLILWILMPIIIIYLFIKSFQYV